MKHVKVATMFSLAIVTLVFGGIIELHLLYFTWMILALTGLLLLLFLKELLVDVVRIHRQSAEHQRSKDMANAHPMNDLLPQDRST
jgi:hypothetical protein